MVQLLLYGASDTRFFVDEQQELVIADPVNRAARPFPPRSTHQRIGPYVIPSRGTRTATVAVASLMRRTRIEPSNEAAGGDAEIDLC